MQQQQPAALTREQTPAWKQQHRRQQRQPLRSNTKRSSPGGHGPEKAQRPRNARPRSARGPQRKPSPFPSSLEAVAILKRAVRGGGELPRYNPADGSTSGLRVAEQGGCSSSSSSFCHGARGTSGAVLILGTSEKTRLCIDPKTCFSQAVLGVFQSGRGR